MTCMVPREKDANVFKIQPNNSDTLNLFGIFLRVTISTLVFSIPHFKDDNPSYIPLLSYIYKIYSEQDKRQAEVRTS